MSALLAATLAACGNNNDTEPAASVSAQQSESQASDNSAIQEGTTKLQEVTKQLQDAIGSQNADEVKKLGKSVNDAWLAYENSVRQAFPLEYVEVEKYVMPIYSASAYDKVDFEALTATAAKLQDAL